VQIALTHEAFLYSGADTVGEEDAIGRNDSAPSAVFQHPFHYLKEKQGGLGGPCSFGEVGLNAGFLFATKWWIGKNHIHSIGSANRRYWCCESIPANDVRLAELMEQKVHHRQKVWERLLLDAS
jgi:hypothetical protein